MGREVLREVGGPWIESRLFVGWVVVGCVVDQYVGSGGFMKNLKIGNVCLLSGRW